MNIAFNKKGDGFSIKERNTLIDVKDQITIITDIHSPNHVLIDNGSWCDVEIKTSDLDRVIKAFKKARKLDNPKDVDIKIEDNEDKSFTVTKNGHCIVIKETLRVTYNSGLITPFTISNDQHAIFVNKYELAVINEYYLYKLG